MPKHAAGRLKEVIYAHFEPNEDLMKGIKQVVVERKIETGLVLSITGGLVKARLSYFPHADRSSRRRSSSTTSRARSRRAGTGSSA